MSRPLRALPAVPGLEFSAAVRAALDGTGPAVLPLSTDPVQAARTAAALRPDEPEPDEEVALVVATSGSTGPPKGVLLTAAAVLASADAAVERLGGPASWWLALPLWHVAGLQVLVRALAAGAPPVLDSADLPPGRRCTSLVPTQLRRMLEDPRTTAALAGFDAVLLGGAAVSPALLRQARAAGVPVTTTYGMTETSGGCVYDGVPLSRVTADVHDRIVLSGPVVARGYRLRPAETAAAFHEQRFRTEDVGHWVDGRLVVDGRADDLVVTGGEKVAPLAVAAALSDHPSVVDCVAFGRPDPEWGAVVVAAVVLRAPLSLDQAREHVAERLGRVAAPRALVPVDTIPGLASGKPDLAALRARA